MKTSIATTLSVVGVIAAGASAYAVNTSVLGGATEKPAAIATTIPAPVAAPVAAPASAGTITNAAVKPQQSPTSATTTTYKVGNAGSVVIDISSGRIVVTSILPAAGFTSEPARTDANGVVKVHFVSATQRIEFIATLQNGVVVTDVVSENTTTVTPNDRPSYNDDHDDDDDHEEREHEDDEHEEDEDDD